MINNILKNIGWTFKSSDDLGKSTVVHSSDNNKWIHLKEIPFDEQTEEQKIASLKFRRSFGIMDDEIGYYTKAGLRVSIKTDGTRMVESFWK